MFIYSDGFYLSFKWKYQNTPNLIAKPFDWEWDHRKMIIFSSMAIKSQYK